MDAYFGTETLKLVLSDGRSFDLDQVMSGSGIRYEKDNVVFIGKGSDAMLQEGGATTYENCVANSSNDTDVNGISKFTDQGKTISFRILVIYIFLVEIWGIHHLGVQIHSL